MSPFHFKPIQTVVGGWGGGGGGGFKVPTPCSNLAKDRTVNGRTPSFCDFSCWLRLRL